MIRAAAALILTVLPPTAIGATGPDARLHTLLAEKQAGAPRRCVTPDFSARPQIIDGTAIVYRRGRDTYVGRFRDGCPQLRDDRTIVTQVATGQICANDQVRVVQAGGGSGFGFCIFDGFTPYR